MADKDNEISTGNILSGIFTLIFVIIWVVAGFTGFIMSLVCLSYDGSTGSKVAGVLLSIFFGPFYWFYYIFRKTYCINNSNNNYYPQ
jgi:hypothetical protein